MITNANRFYVYCYFDSLDTPIYVGKGTGGRMRSHCSPKVYRTGSLYFYDKLREMERRGEQWSCRSLRQEMTEPEALDHESEVIKKLGRICLDSGPLTNSVNDRDSWLDHFLAGTRPVGCYNPKTGQLVKRYSYEFDPRSGHGAGADVAMKLQADGFDSNAILNGALYGLGHPSPRRYANFDWHYIPRTQDELKALREIFPLYDASVPKYTEEVRKRAFEASELRRIQNEEKRARRKERLISKLQIQTSLPISTAAERHPPEQMPGPKRNG